MKDWYYLSIVDKARPEGQRWVGACVVKATNPEDAMKEVEDFGVLNGTTILDGEIICVKFPDNISPKASDIYRLIISPQEARELECIES
jgi:hypothetical protein